MNCRVCIALSSVLWGIDLTFYVFFFGTSFLVDVVFLFAYCSRFVLFCFLRFFNSRARASFLSAGIIINTTIMRETDMFPLAQNVYQFRFYGDHSIDLVVQLVSIWYIQQTVKFNANP